MATFYARFQGFIVTANRDGSIPLNAKVVTGLPVYTDSYNETAVDELIAQANEAAESEGK